VRRETFNVFDFMRAAAKAVQLDFGLKSLRTQIGGSGRARCNWRVLDSLSVAREGTLRLTGGLGGDL
jgi:hypothetical protein